MESTLRDLKDSDSSNSSSFENVSMAGCSDFDMDEASVSTRISDGEHDIAMVEDVDVMESSTTTAIEKADETEVSETEAKLDVSVTTAIESSVSEELVDDLDNTRDNIPELETEPESDDEDVDDHEQRVVETSQDSCLDESGCCCEPYVIPSEQVLKANELVAKIIEKTQETTEHLEKVTKQLEEKLEDNQEAQMWNSAIRLGVYFLVGLILGLIFTAYLSNNSDASKLKTEMAQVQETVKSLQNEVSQLHEDLKYAKYENNKKANLEMIQNMTRGIGVFAKNFAEKALNATKQIKHFVENNFENAPKIEMISVEREESEGTASYPSFCFRNMLFQSPGQKTCILFKLFRR